MKNKKAVICTLLFAMVVIGAVIGAMLVKNEHFNLYELIANCVFVSWVLKKIENFYYWLTEE